MDIAEVEENLFAASDAKVWTVYTNWLNLNGAFGNFVEFFHWILDSLLFILLNSTILLFIDKGAFLFICLVVVSLCINALCMPAHFRSTNVLSQVDKDSLDFYANLILNEGVIVQYMVTFIKLVFQTLVSCHYWISILMQLHGDMCKKLSALYCKILSVFPSLEASRPRSKSGIQALCSLHIALEKAKNILHHCSECSKLYLVWTFCYNI